MNIIQKIINSSGQAVDAGIPVVFSESEGLLVVPLGIDVRHLEEEHNITLYLQSRDEENNYYEIMEQDLPIPEKEIGEPGGGVDPNNYNAFVKKVEELFTEVRGRLETIEMRQNMLAKAIADNAEAKQEAMSELEQA